MTGLIAWQPGAPPISANVFLDMAPVGCGAFAKSTTNQSYADEEPRATDRLDGKGRAAFAPGYDSVGALKTLVG
jgi:hypothetical protein